MSVSATTPISIPDEREASRILQGMREKVEQDANLDQVFTEESLAALATLRRLAAEKVSLASPVDRLASTPVLELRPPGDTNAEEVKAVTRLDVDLVQVDLVDEKLCLRRERGRWLVDLTETAARFSGTGRYR